MGPHYAENKDDTSRFVLAEWLDNYEMGLQGAESLNVEVHKYSSVHT
jgi:hypothetical protein